MSPPVQTADMEDAPRASPSAFYSQEDMRTKWIGNRAASNRFHIETFFSVSLQNFSKSGLNKLFQLFSLQLKAKLSLQ